MWHGIWEAQPTGTTRLHDDRLGSGDDADRDRRDRPAGLVGETGDAWAAPGKLPAALVATFPDPNPNVLRDGELRAYDSRGLVQFRKKFENKFVQPLCDTPKRRVWVEVSAKAVTRVFVRQGSTTHTVALPYQPPRASFPNPAAASAGGGRLIVGTYMPSTDRRRVMTYWLRVSRSGVPSIVSHGITDWVSASLTPSGDKAAILTASGLGDGPNWWVSFGKFHGRMLPGNDAGMLDASSQRIFEQGGYSYGSDTVFWGATTVEVFDRSLFAVYKRTST